MKPLTPEVVPTNRRPKNLHIVVPVELLEQLLSNLELSDKNDELIRQAEKLIANAEEALR